MPDSPNSQAVKRPDLATVAEFDLEMQRRNYIGLQILPRFNAPTQSGTFGKIPIKELLASAGEKLERAAKSGFNRADWEFVEDSFATRERGVEEAIDDRERKLYEDYFSALLVATQRCYDRLFAGYEQRVIEAAVNATVTKGQTTGAGTAWTNASTSKPRDNVKAAAKAMWSRTGFWPNTLVISRLAYRDLQDNEQVIGRMAGLGAGQSTMPAEVTKQRLAELFDVDQVLVADAIKLSSGTTVGSLWPDDKALLIRTATGLDFQEPAFGRTLVYTGVVGDFEPQPELYREEKIAGDVVRLRHESQEKVIYPEMAQVITGIA